MRRRDRQNEIIVALVVAIAMGFALVISIVLSIDDDNDTTDQNTPTQVANATRPTVATAFAPSNTPTATPSEIDEIVAKPTETLKPTDTDEPPSETPTPTGTDTDTPTPSDTPTERPTRTPRPTATDTATERPTRTPRPAATDTATERPTRTPRPTNTATDTPTHTPSATRTPSWTPIATQEISILAPTQTTIALIPRTDEPPSASNEPPSVAIRPTPTACVPRSDWEIYQVEIGDTFFSIARSYDLSVDQLAAANCIADPSRILAGQPLRVPDSAFSRADAAIENCNIADGVLTAPRPGDRLDGFVTLKGVARGEGFRRYILDWRPDDPAVDFRSFAEEFTAVTDVGDLGRFNTDAFDPGLYWFRLRVLETNDFIIAECSIRVRFR